MIGYIKIITALKGLTSNVKTMCTSAQTLCTTVVSNSDKIKKILIVILGIYVAFCVGHTSYYLYSRYFNRQPTIPVRDQFDRIEQQQSTAIGNIQTATERLEGVKETIGNSIQQSNSISTGIGKVIDRTSGVEEILNDSQRRIEECQRILNQAR